MSEPCSHCINNSPADTYCLTCSTLLCNECISQHFESSSTRHQLINYQIFLEQNFSKIESKKSIMKNVSCWLKDRLIGANLEVDSQYLQVLNQIKEKQALLHTKVDQIFDQKLNDYKNLSNLNEKTLEFLLSSSTLINPEIITTEDTENFIFSEIFNPNLTKDLEFSIAKELNYNLEIYPVGKPVPIYSFKPNSSQVFMFDILSEEEVVMNVKNFECKSYAGWCLMGSNIIYTGGWKSGYSSFEVFEINTSKWVVEPKPHLLTPRHQHAAICIDKTVYVFGGATKTGLTNLCEKWEYSKDQWIEIQSMQVPKTQMGICVVGKDIYLSNDSEIEKYCTKTDSFSGVNIKFEFRLLSTLVSKDYHVLMFRPGEVLEYETENGLLFKVCNTENIDLWSSTHPVIKMDKVHFFLENLRIVYSFDLVSKKLEILTDFNKSDESYEEAG